MTLPPIDTSDPEALLTRVLELSVPLHPSIAEMDEPGAEYKLVGPPGVASFQRDATDTIRHVSGSPSPLLMPVIDELRQRHMQAVGARGKVDNSHLPALLLLCCYLADGSAIDRLELRDAVRRPARIRLLDEEAGAHDAELEPLEVALRAWTPLEATHAPDAGVHPAILELYFPSDRYTRHVPWEGAAGETAKLPTGGHGHSH